MGMHVIQQGVCGQVHVYGVCVHEERAQVRGMHMGENAVCVCLHRWLHMGVGATRLRSPETRDAERAVPAHLGRKRGLLLHSLGMAWGWTAWGSRHTDCRDSRLRDLHQAPQKQW